MYKMNTVDDGCMDFGATAESLTTLTTPCIQLRNYVVIALQVHWRQGYACSESTNKN